MSRSLNTSMAAISSGVARSAASAITETRYCITDHLLWSGAPLVGRRSPLLRTPPPRSDTAPRIIFQDFPVRRPERSDRSRLLARRPVADDSAGFQGRDLARREAKLVKDLPVVLAQHRGSSPRAVVPVAVDPQRQAVALAGGPVSVGQVTVII